MVAVICGYSPLASVMDHFSTQTGQRFLARALNYRKFVAATQHLRECESCRQRLIALRRNRPGSLFQQILPETPFEDHPSQDLLVAFADGDLPATDRVFLEKHVSECDLCREIITDLSSFRNDLLRRPRKRYTPAPKGVAQPISHAAQGHSAEDWRSTSRQDRTFLQWVYSFKQPLALGFAITAVVSLVVVAFVGPRLSSNLQFASRTTASAATNQIVVMDRDQELLFDSTGLITPTVNLPKIELDAVNHLCVSALRSQPLQAAEALAALISRTQIWRGQQSGPTAYVRVIRPVRTVIKPGRTTFRWTTTSDAKSYTVHVVDDQTQEEVTTSPSILPVENAPISVWTNDAPFSLGRRYRWYVATVINEQEIDAPRMEEPPAKFTVLSEDEFVHLNDLKKANPENQLIEGLLDLRMGLLDDAKDHFQNLLEEPNQTAEGKVFLLSLIEGIEKLKE